MHYRRAKIAIVVVCVCSLIYNASRFAEYSYMSFHFDQEVSELFFNYVSALCHSVRNELYFVVPG